MVRDIALNYLAGQALEAVAPLLAALAERRPPGPPSSLQLVADSMEQLQPRESQWAPDIPIRTEIIHEVTGDTGQLPKIRGL